MFCPKCGKEWKDGARFCSGCGAAMSETQSAAPAATDTPAPAPTPVRAAVPVVSKKRLGGGAIALIVGSAVLLVAAIAIALYFFVFDPGSQSVSGWVPGMPVGADGASPSPSDEILTGSFDISLMDGTYYCAQEAGSTLELHVEEEQLSIYKTYLGAMDISTLIPLPSGPNFTINYGGRLIEFYYSTSGQSVTVSESGYSSMFTLDGDRSWVIDATQDAQDPFSDPKGYILPTDSQYITEADLYPFNEEEVKLIRNEIYARHGYSFTMEKFREYFNSKSWYTENPNVNAQTFGTDQMNEFERANVHTIKAYEEAMGW